jgi:coenzyme Q-binding protein COQ10
MQTHTEELTVPYRPEQMFDLVSDIQRYPEFVRWITALRISKAHEEDGVKTCIGEAVVAFKGFTNNFATHVKANSIENHVEVGLVRGPFKHLLNTWHFSPQGETATRINFYIEYEFSNFILRALARANHEYAIKRIMQTFLDEAKMRYGA